MSKLMPSLNADAFAAVAMRFEHRIVTLRDSVDPSWNFLVGDRDPDEEGRDTAISRRRAASRLYLRCCGTWPSVADLLEPASHLSLLEQGALHARLCALALLVRPGVVRACVERKVREALNVALGPAYGRLREVYVIGAPVPAEAAGWSPLEWAYVGYSDLVQARAWSNKGLRRLVRLSFPRRRSVSISPVAHLLPQFSPLDALGHLDVLFEEIRDAGVA